VAELVPVNKADTMISIFSIGRRCDFMIVSCPQAVAASRLGRAAVSAVPYIPLPFSASASGLRERQCTLFALHNDRWQSE